MIQILGIAALTALFVLTDMWWKKRRLRIAARWPVTEAYVAQVEENRPNDGFPTITVAYTYKVADERYVGRESFTFVRGKDATRFAAGCKQRSALVHYRPDKPSVSVLSRENMPS